MPIYEFLCKNCGDVFEVWQRVSDPAPERCKKCGGPLKKLLSPPGIVFKGSGFHTTDYVPAKEREAEKDKAQKETSPLQDKSPTKTAAAENKE